MRTKLRLSLATVLLAIAMVCGVIGLSLVTTYADGAVRGAELILEDDFSTWKTEPKFQSEDEWQISEESPHVGMYRTTTGTQSISYTFSDEQLGESEGIAYAEIILNSEGGISGHNYRKGILEFNVYAGNSADTLVPVSSTVAACTEADAHKDDIIVRTEAIENGAKVVKLEIEALQANNDYSLGFKDVKIYKFANETAMVLEDNTADSETERKHMPLAEGEAVWTYDAKVGYYRSTNDTQSLTYFADDTSPVYRGVENFALDFYVDGVADPQTAIDVYEFNMGNAVKVNVYAGVDLESLAPVELNYALKDGDNTHLIFSAKEDLEPGSKYIKIELEKIGANNNYAMGLHNVSLNGFYGALETIPVESISVINTENSVIAGGEALALAGEITPADSTFKTITWKVFDDEACTEVSEIASIRGNLLTADHEQSEAVTVYVVAEAGGVKSEPFAVSVEPRPAPQSVTITTYPNSMNVGDVAELVSAVLPVNASSKEVTYTVYDDAECKTVSSKARFEDAKLSALSKGDIYVRAETVVGKILSPAVKITIKEDVLLLDDACDSLSYVYKDTNKDIFQIPAVGYIMRNYANQPNGYAAGPAYEGTDAEKYAPAELIYYVANEISRFEIGIMMYSNTADAILSANNNPYLDFQYEIFSSADGIDWTYIDTDYTVSEPDKKYESSGVTAEGYAQFSVYNTQQLPDGIHYIKIVLIGSVTIASDDPSVNDAQNFYNGTTAISQSPDLSYNDIYAFYNTFAPAVNGVKLYAKEGTEIIDSLLAVTITNTETRLEKGKDLQLKAQLTYSSKPNEPVEWDYSEGNVVFVEGGEYVAYSEGKLKITDTFDNQISQAKFKLVFGDVESDVYTIDLIIPVERVEISMESTTLTVTGEYYEIECNVFPQNATNMSLRYTGTVEGGGNVSDYAQIMNDGRIKPRKAGVILLKAIVDGVESNELRIVIEEEKSEEITITVTSPKTMKVGDEISLAATVTPEGAGDIVWNIKSGSDIATLQGNALKATGEGTVVVQATVGDATVEHTITVSAADAAGEEGGCSSAVGTASAVFCGLVIVSLGTVAVLLKKKSNHNN